MADEKTCGVNVPVSGDGGGCELERNHLFEHMVSMGEGKRAFRARDWSAPDEPKRCAARAISEDSKSRITTCQCDYPAGHDGSHHGRHSDGGGASCWEPAPGDGDGTVRLLHDPALLSPAEAHVLRSIVASYSDIGYVDLEMRDTEWRRALWSLAKRGLVSAYLATPAGKEVDGMLREGALDIAGRRGVVR